MDFKLPSSTLERDCWKAHQEFLRIARRKEIFVKAVVSDSTVEGDIEKSISLIKAQGKRVPFVLQPVEGCEGRISRERLSHFLEMASAAGLADARIIPQTHKLLGVR